MARQWPSAGPWFLHTIGTKSALVGGFSGRLSVLNQPITTKLAVSQLERVRVQEEKREREGAHKEGTHKGSHLSTLDLFPSEVVSEKIVMAGKRLYVITVITGRKW